jgi:hypothetical protein
MERPGLLAIASVVGAIAIGGTSVWAFGSPRASHPCPTVAAPPTSSGRLTRAQRSETVAVARADPLVKAILGSQTLREMPPGSGPGYDVWPRALTQSHIGLVATVVFTPNGVVRGSFRWRNTGGQRDGCLESFWTQDYEGDATTTKPSGEFVAGAPQISAMVSLDRRRVIALIPMVFNEPGMRPIGERDYLYRDK